ncbi:MAG: ABC transporter ATP-binding protein [Hydrogenibacillus sp.]|nr:ABC transporter ATP-binding protein [Hydrogenibacillus sp.]
MPHVHHEDQAKPPRSAKPRVARRLLAYAFTEWRTLLLGFFFLAIATLADVGGPVVLKHFIDGYLTPLHFPFGPVAALAGLYFALLVVSPAFHYLQYVKFNEAAQRIIRAIRVDVFAKVERMALSFFDRTPVGWVVSRVTNDTEAIKELYVSVLAAFVQNIVFLLGVFIGMFYLDAGMALYLAWVVPVVLLLMWVYRRVSGPIIHRTREKLSDVNTMLSEMLMGMSIVQAFRQEERLRTRFASLSADYFHSFLRQIKINGLLVRPAVDVLYLVAAVVLLSVFGVRSWHGPVELGVMYAFISYIDRMFEPINEMMFRLTSFQQALVAGERVFGLMDMDEREPVPEAPEAFEIPHGRVEFRDVTFSYDGKQEVLKGISFVAEPGMTVALVGHTGSGKSTIANLLLRFYRPASGEILIDGVPLALYDEAALRRQVGLVLQDPVLFVGDIAFNIRLHDDYSDEAVEEAARFVQADRLIERLPQRYEEPVVERGATLSSGERQLIAFARTMVRQPKILVLDEATANIDTETEGLIQEALARMRRGRTTIVIAHRLSTIQDADLILVLHQGEIVERGTHPELLARGGLYAAMYRMQQGGAAAASERPAATGGGAASAD